MKEKSFSKKTIIALIILILGSSFLILSMAFSIAFGAANIDLATVWQSVTSFDAGRTEHQIIHRLRMPRAVAAALVGAGLAVSGAIMQGMTRNPLASPSIMGVTAGATFMIALALAFVTSLSSLGLMLAAFIGAGVGAGLVFGIGSLSRNGLTPVKLALAGSAITALLSSISSAIAIQFDVAKDLSFWYAGGVAGIQWANVTPIIPVVLIGLIIAFMISSSITVMSLGDDVATGLGQRTGLVKILGILAVLLLTGAAVSISGTIGFVGLVIPHITRFLVGTDYRWILPCSAVLGGLLLVLADIAGRMVNPPFETPVGAITALIGVPFFLYLARREGRGL
ncbi:iron complex transport system permease protein [Cytobacillus purgationiresistens]|uniref:Iron complex transport system permease protein n=1 Tax=Cytobacillus purgationiresistens TaxID=863449 RepID=A0ABU0ACM7_9BACI|nr:iron complex transport system permease protein [Cytobacillus purgationiresistens]